MNTDRKVVIGAALEEPPTELGRVFALPVVKQLGVADVAECLGLSVETVKTPLFHTRQRPKRLSTPEIDAATQRVIEFHLIRCGRVVAPVLEQLRRTDNGAVRGTRVGKNY